MPGNHWSCQGRELRLCWLVSVWSEQQVTIVIVVRTGIITMGSMHIAWTKCQTLLIDSWIPATTLIG